jgi:putative hydrolase of the HAD superfamily
MIDALVFDLDDTLYPECDFVASGYQAVAHHLSLRYGCSETEVFSAMMATFTSLGREKVFSMVLDRFLDTSVSVNELVETYRRHTPVIRLLPDYEDLLESLRRDFRLGIITDGLPAVQKRKVQALHLETLVDKIIYTWEFGPEFEKPHPFCFSLMLDCLRTAPSKSIFIGDNADKDWRGAHSVGMRFVRVLTDNRVEERSDHGRAGTPEFVIKNLNELPRVLQLSESYETV